MKISNRGLALLAYFEALILTPYLCAANVRTIGLGATASDIPDLKSWPWDKTITIEESIELFKKHVVKYETAVNRALKREISQHQFDALVSITYNIGTGGMRTSTFMSRVNAGDSDARVCEAIKRWNKGGGRVLTGLVTRRAKECTLYTDGRYAGEGKVLVAPVNEKHRPVYSKGYYINFLEYLNVEE